MRPATSPLVVIFALWLAGLGAAGQFAKVSVAFPALRDVYPEADAALGLAVSLISFVGVVLGLVAGMIVARLGVRRMLIWGLALGAAISALQASLPAFWVMLLLRLVEGLSHLVIVVAAPTLIAELAPGGWRAAALTLWGTFFGVAFALAAALGLPLIVWGGPGALFLAHAIWMAAMAALLVWLLPRGRIIQQPERLSLRGVLRAHLTIYASPRLSAPALGWLCYTLTFVALLTVLPLVLGAGLPGWLLGALPLASIAMALTLVVALLRVFTAVQVVVAGFAMSALSVVMVLLWPGALWPVFALFSTLALVQSASFAAVPELNARPGDRGLANGAMAQMGNLGNLTGTPVLLVALGGMGPTGGLGFVLLAYLAGLAVHLALAQARR